MSTTRSNEVFNNTTLALFEALSKISDPRKKRGVRHNVHSILKLVILGFCSRLVCLEHIVEFATHCWESIKGPLGFTRNRPPDATTIGRVLKRIDREELEEIFREWVSSKVYGKEIDASVDGKALRNVCDEKGNPIYMVNVFAHDVQMVLAQEEIPEKKGESTTFRSMLEGLFNKYPGLRLLTGDAAFNGRDLCKEIARLGKHYLVQIKGNQKQVYKILQLHFDEEKQDRAPDAKSVEKKVSEKTIVRELWICNGFTVDYIRENLNYPAFLQVGYLRKRTYLKNSLISQEHHYGVTSCSKSELSPEKFMDKTRKHWEIENGLHHVKNRS